MKIVDLGSLGRLALSSIMLLSLLTMGSCVPVRIIEDDRCKYVIGRLEWYDESRVEMRVLRWIVHRRVGLTEFGAMEETGLGMTDPEGAFQFRRPTIGPLSNRREQGGVVSLWMWWHHRWYLVSAHAYYDPAYVWGDEKDMWPSGEHQIVPAVWSGRVVVSDIGTGLPISGAIVRVALSGGGPAPGLVGVTDDDGMVKFSGLGDCGWLEFIVEGEGYVPMRMPVHGFLEDPRAGIHDVGWQEAKLSPGREVYGYVRGERGELVGNAWVMFFHWFRQEEEYGMHDLLYYIETGEEDLSFLRGSNGSYWYVDLDDAGGFRCTVANVGMSGIVFGAPGYKTKARSLTDKTGRVEVELKRRPSSLPAPR